MLLTVDNFQGDLDVQQTKSQLKKLPKDIGYKAYLSSSKANNKPQIHVFLKDYLALSEDHFLLDVVGKADKRDYEDLIFSTSQVSTNAESVKAETGNYVGKFTWEGVEIDIRSRFSDIFLKRMLNFVNDIFLDDVNVFDAKESEHIDFSRFIIYYMFIQKLEKAFLLGLPKGYRTIQHHEIKVKGRIDINRFIKKDNPFQGKVSSTSREQKEVQEIVDVLHKAVQILDKNSGSWTRNIVHIKSYLKQKKSNQSVLTATVQKALASNALQNPIFIPYHSVLQFAKYIIDRSNLEESIRGKTKSLGFLVNVAELFEVYVAKLLQKEFPDWQINSPKITVYENQFFARNIIPDIVMRKDKQILVFDTKYKRMLMRPRNEYGAGDMDRIDFFQINTYMSYYQQQGFDVVAGGLLYPMEKAFQRNTCYSDLWLGNQNTHFIVDGIDLSELKDSSSIKDIVEYERSFIERIRKITVKYDDVRSNRLTNNLGQVHIKI